MPTSRAEGQYPGRPGGELRIRPMREADVAAAQRLSDDAFFSLDDATASRLTPVPRRRSEAHAEAWEARTRYLLQRDAAGCWVAELAGADRMVGFATSVVREGMWILVTFAVEPGHQGHGIGRQLLDVAQQHGRGCLRAMLSSSVDPQATRRYHAAGFALHPQMYLHGEVDAAALPEVRHVREGGPADVDLMDSVDRRTRGAAHGPDHAFWLARGRCLVVADRTGEGYAYLSDGGVELLAASNRRTAARLLLAALGEHVGGGGGGGGGEVRIGHITGANQWALDVGLGVGLRLDQSGYLGLRGMRPPTPYLHHGALL